MDDVEVLMESLIASSEGLYSDESDSFNHISISSSRIK